jgi:hypothetical protein
LIAEWEAMGDEQNHGDDEVSSFLYTQLWTQTFYPTTTLLFRPISFCSDTTTESSCHFWKFYRNLGCRLLYRCLP